jgi:hypothetical protein
LLGVEIVAIALTSSNVAALVLATTAARRARYWKSVVEGPHADRLDVPDTLERVCGR